MKMGGGGGGGGGEGGEGRGEWRKENGIVLIVLWKHCQLLFHFLLYAIKKKPILNHLCWLEANSKLESGAWSVDWGWTLFGSQHSFRFHRNKSEW